MQLLYQKYYQQLKRGFTEVEFRTEAEKLAGVSLSDFFDYIYTVMNVDYTTYLQYGGLQVTITPQAGKNTFYAIAPVATPGSLAKTIRNHWWRQGK